VPISVEYIHLCEHAFLDSRGNPCIIGLLSEILAKRFPLHLPVISAAIGFRVPPTESATLRLQFGDSHNVREYTVPVNGRPDGTVDALRLFQMQFPFIHIVQPSTIALRVFDGDRCIGERLITVRAANPT